MDKKKVEKIIKQVKHTMDCEKMPLTQQDIQNGKDILEGKKTGDQVVAEELAKMKEEGLIK